MSDSIRFLFSLRWLLAVTGLLAALIAGGFQIMPEADGHDPRIVWGGPIFLAVAILGGALNCVAIGRCFMVIHEALAAGRDLGRRLLRSGSQPPQS